MVTTSQSREPTRDARQAVRYSGLHYANDTQPGWACRRRGKGLSCYDEKGRALCDKEKLKRIKDLATPPAWEEVWISPDPQGHIRLPGAINATANSTAIIPTGDAPVNSLNIAD